MPEKGRILVVDDEPRNVKLMNAYLNSAGYEVLSAFNGEDGLRQAAAENPDVILLDIMMPGMDGFEVTRRLKANSKTQQIPVVLVTALEGVDKRVKGLDVGADEFINKPVNSTELLARVRALHRMKKMQDELRNRVEVERDIVQPDSPESIGQDTVLLIEDTELVADQISLLLRKQGFLVTYSATAGGAVDLIHEVKPDIILLDIMLPDRNGIQVLDSLKANALTCDIPVILMSALADLDTKVRGIEHGADDYVVKPVHNAELLARLRACLRRSKANEKLKYTLDRLLTDNVIDSMTGARNRHYLDSDLKHRIAVAQRHPMRGFSVAMLDIDHFKSVNDRFGHLAGDAVLRHISNIMLGVVRASDIVARYGGEEFCILMPETDLPQAIVLAERIRAAIAGQPLVEPENINVTASFGVVTWTEQDQKSNDILGRADHALYQAKHSGRNRVCVDGYAA